MTVILLLLVLFPSGPVTVAAQFDDIAVCKAALVEKVPAYVAGVRDDSGAKPIGYAASCTPFVELQQGVDL